MPLDLILKKNLLKSVLANPMNSAWDPQKTQTAHFFSFLVQSKPILRLNSFGCGGDFGPLLQLTSHEPGIAASIVICARKIN